ncbi:hypothetical protein [Sphingobacterium corticibacterium]|uniref:Uncharacterized protein n=1 Tax=Sphingobacterium corticibacterium TaxID=2484746 RepID=A0A4Q6XXZ0_9SPHI|nr:hypothetical protein [Sphingobacterium corticibacterium]RZF61657.1 hypothetical protein EWE74_02105 [Sphingobacterium corticibacterium]
MKITHILSIVFLFLGSSFLSIAHAQQEHIARLELGKKKKKTFNSRDSSAVIYIDTLIMKDKSSLQFYGKKDIKLVVKHAEIGKGAFISGIGGQNNASDFDIDINLNKLGSLYVIARGQDAMNGTKTDPNGDGGNVSFKYDPNGITPQTADKKQANYVYIDVSAGGRAINPVSDLNQIYSRIAMSAPGLRGMPQGQVYSGSPGKEGNAVITESK